MDVSLGDEEETKRSRKLTEDSFAVSKKSFYSFRVMNRQCKKYKFLW